MISIRVDKPEELGFDISIFVSFSYDNRILEVVRSYPNRNWNKDKKEWELPLDKLESLISNLPEQEFDININTQIVEKETGIPDGFKFKTQPFRHQLESFEYGLAHDRWFLGDEQGLGKTKQAIDIAVAKKLQKGYRHCLIICGVNGLKWNWVNEIHTHSDEGAYILGQRIKNRKVVIGSNQAKYNDVVALHAIDDYFIITNVETLRDEIIAKAIQEACNCGLIGVVIIDEIHKCKNPTSQQGKGILKIQSECRIAMTGTPLMNNPLDLYIILKWLGYENHAFYSFKKHYCNYGGFGGYEIVGYKNLSELKEKLNDIMLRRKKEEVLDLPEKLYIDEYVEMTAKQEKIYDEVTSYIKENIDQIKTAPNPLAELIRMRQATGYTGILSSTIQESAKLDRMEELVEEALENGKQVVIFSNWTQMTDEIYRRLNSKLLFVDRITGQTKDVNRDWVVQRFQNGEIKVLIGTIGAMGTGLTLTAGTVEIFLDEPWTKAAKEQAEDRCHRVGTTENITIYTLMCKNTIDERIHELVLEKGEMADMMVDGKINNSNKTELLDFLLN